MTTGDSYRERMGAYALVLSGICFTLFPVVRPFFDETSLQGAVQFASNRWVIAHALGMAGFIFLGLGFLGAYARLEDTSAGRRSFVALTLCWIGGGLTLPFFGAEAFSLQVIGRTAAQESSPAVLAMVDAVRFGPGIVFIGVGLLTVAAAAIVLATAVWKAGLRPRWGGIPLAAGFVVYIPQLQGGAGFQPIRIAVGLLITAGAIWVARGILGGPR